MNERNSSLLLQKAHERDWNLNLGSLIFHLHTIILGSTTGVILFESLFVLVKLRVSIISQLLSRGRSGMILNGCIVEVIKGLSSSKRWS